MSIPGAIPSLSAQPVEGTLVVPGGTLMLVRMQTGVSSSSRVGTRFTCLLEGDLYAGSQLVAPSGTLIYGQVTKARRAGRLVGRPELELILSEMNLEGKVVPIMTTSFSEVGASSFKKTARGAITGAVIGEIADDDAEAGAMIGSGVTALRKGDRIVVPPNTILEFRLSQPLYLPANL